MTPTQTHIDAMRTGDAAQVVRAIRAEALRYAAELHAQSPPSEHYEFNRRLLAEADRIEKGEQ